MTYQEELTATFRREYGKLCTLAALALTRGHPRSLVSEAVCGNGAQVAPVYVKLRAQRALTNHSLRTAKAAGVEMETLAAVAKMGRKMVEQEWMLGIPMFSEAST